MSQAIGLDAGGTLTKLAYLDENNQLKLKHFPSNNMPAIINWINSKHNIKEIGITGGRAEQVKTMLDQDTNLHYIVEFEATLKGVRYQLEKENHNFDKCIITNIGTGTSIHYMNQIEHMRVGGTGVGGGTLIGLSALTTGIINYQEILQLAKKGSRMGIDLLVQDIYQGMETPISPTLTASNFGKVGINDVLEYKTEDILATIQGLVGEVITTLSIQLAEQNEVEQIVYIGTTLDNNEKLRDIIADYTILKKKTPVFLEDHGFSGAIGALINVTQ
ncbi:type II pantothenate kinase [Rummeliibacillus sp. G93]|uniref:type II pantothenate kinase n=1 Tax=Rummeliibacillus TaxID=648802 RepID=UPI0011759E75|nr:MULTISPECIES: type II pantothenate kinase [Rummeliibacillus]MBB5168934.1 type II pantothenate kinase [Rummeliibacillus stabekisii]UQW96302.1 type II pantothenate kinase [Rummeliibacillus sp. G93]GEL05575.1 type II pantothenate kinase [Rummeliibacillus stabekisii]